MKTIEERIKFCVAEQLGIAEQDLKASTHIVDDLGADSLDEVELVMFLEDEFEIEIPDEAAMVNLTIQQMVDYITSRESEISK